MITNNSQSWTGDTPTPSASPSGSSVSTLTVVEPVFLSKCDVGEAFELTYWSAIQKYWQQDPEEDYDSQYEQKQGKEEEQPLDPFELVDISLDDDSELKGEIDVGAEGIIKQIRRWWGSNVSMIIPDDQDVRDHFCRSPFPIYTDRKTRETRRLIAMPQP